MIKLLSHIIAIIPYYYWKIFKGKPVCEYIQLNDVKIYYEISGHGEPLLLLHGVGGFIESFYKIIPSLSKKYKVIAMDSRGHGRSSDTTESITYEKMALDVVSLLNHLNIKKTNVLGWSDGAITAIHLSIYSPERINSIISVGVNTQVNGLKTDAIKYFTEVTPKSWNALSRLSYKYFAPNPEYWEKLVYKLKVMLLTLPNYSDKELQNIKTPILLIIGDKDELISLEHTAEISELIPSSKLFIFKNATHNIPLENPKEIVSAINTFITNQLPKTI